MPRSSLTIRIDAPVAVVFDAVAHIENYMQAVPHIVNVEFFSETRRGVGTRFRETRLMKGREATSDLEVTEYESDSHVRIVSDTHGTVWDTLFSVAQKDGGTDLSLDMDARAHKLLPKLMNPLILPMIKKFVVADMEAVKAFCEARSDSVGTAGESA